MGAHGAGWTQLDAIDGWQRRLLQLTRCKPSQGTIKLRAHSTKMVADREVTHIQGAGDKPIFAVLSIFNMHGPTNRRPRTSTTHGATCRPRTRPTTTRRTFRQATGHPGAAAAPNAERLADGHLLRGDAGHRPGGRPVTNELRPKGGSTTRCSCSPPTTAWPGVSIGWARRRSLPYTTPVPLYVRCPARWGDEQRDSRRPRRQYRPRSDLLCHRRERLSSRSLSPKGQSGPDGKNMLPLLDQNQPSIGGALP